MKELFRELNMNVSLLEALDAMGISEPTGIQKRAVPEALKNADLYLQSETGTGKTLAFLLPLFQKLDTAKKETQAIILVPTHELAMQIHAQIQHLSSHSDIKASSAPIIGNVNIDRQIKMLKEKPHIIVGSAGRILELIKKRKISAHTVRTIILDEADRLLDDSNIDYVKAVIKSTLKERQLLMASATISPEAEKRAMELMKDGQVVRSEEKVTIPETIEHIYFTCEQRDKIEVLRKLVRIMEPQRAIVFVAEKEDAEIFTAKLNYHGIKAESIHGANIKLDRKKAMDDFKTGKIQLLIASDIAARGLHIEDVSHVFNMNMPEKPGEYLHRAGRTGRNGKTGTSVSIVTDRELPFLRACEKALGINIKPKTMFRGEIIDVKRS